MNTYKLQKRGDEIVCVLRSDGWSIPFATENTDYQKFKADVLAGEQLQDADGNVMTQEATTAFISELP